MAVEDAHSLFTALSLQGGLGEGRGRGVRGMNRMKYSTALAYYEELRGARVWKLHHLSNIAQTVGHLESQSLITLRDWLLLLGDDRQGIGARAGIGTEGAGDTKVVAKIKGWFFDRILSLTVSR